MKKENDEITDLFRSRLADAEMPVRDGFWQHLQSDTAACSHRRRLAFFRIAAAASVLLVLAASSAAFWFFSPKEEIEEAFTQVAAVTGTSSGLDGDVVKQDFTPICAQPVLQPNHSRPVTLLSHYPGAGDEDSVSVTVSMSFSFSATRRVVCDNRNHADGDIWQTGSNGAPVGGSGEEFSLVPASVDAGRPKTWAVKAAIGTALPAGSGKYKMPVTAGVTVERKFNKHLALETGLLYTNLRAAQNLHYLGIPVKLNITLAETPKLELYASVGGVADKCMAGAPDNDFRHEPVQLAVMAGVGVSYKVSDKIALFAEPGVSHHFKTDSKLETLRTARPTNFNLICGLRMTY